MTQSAAPATTGTVFVGKCAACKTRYSYVDTAANASANYMPNAPYCGCRTSQGQPRTWIKFAPVKATLSGKACDASCRSGISPICVCSCGGDSHGADNRIGE
jgi:hypothetical protein